MTPTEAAGKLHPASRCSSSHRDLSGVRILVVMPSIPLQGMERANLQIMRMMRERQADVLFATEATWGDGVRREAEARGCGWAAGPFACRIGVPRGPFEALRMFAAWARAAWTMDQICRAFAPTHVYVTNLTYFFLALPTLLRSRPHVVFRVPNPPDPRASGWRRRLSRGVWRRVVARVSDVLVCNSKYSGSILHAMGIPDAKLRLIYNCVPERCGAQASDAPEVAPGRLNVIYLGKIRMAKGVQQLFDVAARMVCEREDVDFYFVGEHHWQNPFAATLIAAVHRAGLANRIRFPGVVGDVFGMLSKCHVHVSPSVSHLESLPNAVLEAKAMGVPSVVFPTGGLPEAVTHGVDGYVCEEPSVDALYQGIRYFLDNPEARAASGRAAARSLERFSRERAGEEWARVFAAESGSRKVTPQR